MRGIASDAASGCSSNDTRVTLSEHGQTLDTCVEILGKHEAELLEAIGVRDWVAHSERQCSIE